MKNIKNLLKATILTLTLTITTTLAFPAMATTTTNGWIQNGSNWNYYVNGKIVVNGVIQDKGKLYYIDNQGNLENGWFTKNGSTVYFQNGLLATGWTQIDSKWYYFNEFGEMLAGTQDINGKAYNLASDGHWIE